jgi:glycerophosphoryl diester phosphodiesterase
MISKKRWTASLQKRYLLVSLLLMFGLCVDVLRSAANAESNIIHSPSIIAHRGGRKWAPENTLSAFKQSIETGCDGIEIDVQRCKTGQLLVIHDETLERTTNGAGYVFQKSYDEIRALDAGKWFSPQYRDERVPTLKEVLDLVNGRLIVDVEIRNVPVACPGIEDDVIALLAQYKYPDKIVISSFDHDILHRIHESAPRYKLALLTVCIPYDLGNYAAQVGAKAWNLNMAELREDLVKRAHKARLEVAVWTVNDAKDWQRAADIGVDSIITDDPIGLMEYLRVRTTASAF